MGLEFGLIDTLDENPACFPAMAQLRSDFDQTESVWLGNVVISRYRFSTD